MPQSARKTDAHTCPSFTGNTPHEGGPITSPCSPDVDIENQPASRGSEAKTCDFALCKTGEPDFIAEGSGTVMINNMHATRVGDMTMHAGVITGHASDVEVGGPKVRFRPVNQRGASKEVSSEKPKETTPQEPIKEPPPDGKVPPKKPPQAPPAASCPVDLVVTCAHERRDNGQVLEVRGGDSVTLSVEPANIAGFTLGVSGASTSSTFAVPPNHFELIPLIRGTVSPDIYAFECRKDGCGTLSKELRVYPNESVNTSLSIDSTMRDLLELCAGIANFVEFITGKRFDIAGKDGLKLPLPGGMLSVPLPTFSLGLSAAYEECTKDDGPQYWEVWRQLTCSVSVRVEIKLSIYLGELAATAFPVLRGAYTRLADYLNEGEDPFQLWMSIALVGELAGTGRCPPTSPWKFGASGSLSLTGAMGLTFGLSIRVVDVSATVQGSVSGRGSLSHDLKADLVGQIGPIDASLAIKFDVGGWFDWEFGDTFELMSARSTNGGPVDILEMIGRLAGP